MEEFIAEGATLLDSVKQSEGIKGVSFAKIEGLRSKIESRITNDAVVSKMIARNTIVSEDGASQEDLHARGTAVLAKLQDC